MGKCIHFFCQARKRLFVDPVFLCLAAVATAVFSGRAAEKRIYLTVLPWRWQAPLLWCFLSLFLQVPSIGKNFETDKRIIVHVSCICTSKLDAIRNRLPVRIATFHQLQFQLLEWHLWIGIASQSLTTHTPLALTWRRTFVIVSEHATETFCFSYRSCKASVFPPQPNNRAVHVIGLRFAVNVNEDPLC